jgi:hypothetical protein
MQAPVACDYQLIWAEKAAGIVLAKPANTIFPSTLIIKYPDFLLLIITIELLP